MADFLKGILWIIAALAVLVLLLRVFLWFQRKRYREKQNYTVLSVRVAKDNEAGPIVAEQIFATLHGIYHPLSWKEKFKGRGLDHLSFEMAHANRQIRFYIWCPVSLKNLVESQIYAQYPGVEIFEAEDYAKLSGLEIKEAPRELAQSKALISAEKNVPAEKTKEKFFLQSAYPLVVGAELKLSEPIIYPIKRYVQFEDKLTRVAAEPMAGITASLAKLGESSEQAWIQIAARPLPDKWRTLFIKCIRILRKGIWANIETLQKTYARMFCTRRKACRIIFFPLYFIFWIQGLTSGVSKKARAEKGSTSFQSDELREEMSRTHERETELQAAADKVTKLLFEVNIRLAYLSSEKNLEAAKVKIREMAGSFKQFNIPQLNGFQIKKISTSSFFLKRYQNRVLKNPFVLNSEELATIYHFPNLTVQTPNIDWVKSRKLEPPSDFPTPSNTEASQFTLLGKTNFRGMHQEFGIKEIDRRRHIYIIGKTGMGKSTLLESMIYSDIKSGRGVGVVDPHGDLADKVLNFIPSARTNQVIIFDPSDRDFPVAFNMLENLDPNLNTIVCSGLVGIFKKIYAESWGPRLEHILRNTILSLLEYPGTTMLGITRILQDSEFRRRVVKKITDPIVKNFWIHEFEKMPERQRIEAISPILNKVGQFLSSPIIRNIVGQSKSAIDFRFAMDKGKIVVVNLSKGKIGEDNSALLGAMIITKFQLDAMSRANIPEKERKDFYLYVDEFQNFATEAFATILSEARKYRLNLTLANQYIAQMPDEVKDAVFGNAGTLISFQVGYEDAEYLSTQFAEEVTPNDLVSLSKYTIYTRLLIEGVPSKTFSADTLPPPVFGVEEERREKVIRLARERYSKPREIVEDKIRRWSEGPKKLSSPKKKYK